MTGQSNEALAAEVERSRFTPTRIREGYDMGEVDRFLEDLCARLRAGGPVAGLVARARFTPVRMREGYDMHEVDRLLERVVRESGEGPAEAAGMAPAAPTVPAEVHVSVAEQWTIRSPRSTRRSPGSSAVGDRSRLGTALRWHTPAGERVP